MTEDAFQALTNETMEDKGETENLIIINLTLHYILNQAQETILVLSKKLQALQAQTNSKKPATEKPSTDNKQHLNKSKRYCWTHGRNHSLDHTSVT